jgi:4-amino-4-deoxy-L-arabinose transferase-like glycosyltransferase
LARALAMAVIPVLDTTEGRYAQVSQEMAVAGDWVTPRVWVNGEHLPFLGKPPLFFWTAAGAMKLCGVNGFAARLPSLLATIAVLGLLYRVMERYGGRGSGLLSVVVALSCGAFFVICGTVIVDMVLCACVAGSLLAYFAFTCEPSVQGRRRWSLLVFVLLAIGFLTKGPVAVILFGLPVLVWTLRWREWGALRDHRWTLGIVLFLVMVTPWFALCELRNPGFLKYFFLNENLLRYVTHDYGDIYGQGHLYPRGAALVMMLVASAPWSLFALWFLVRRRILRQTLTLADKRASFLFLGFSVGTLFWCLARQLLITYTMPMVPLFAGWLALTTQAEPDLQRRMAATAAALALLLGAVMLAGAPFLQSGKNTTRQIVRVAQQYASEHAIDGPLLFAHRTPYSALFYARGWVIPLPRKENLVKSLGRCPAGAGSALLVVSAARGGEAELASLPVGSADVVATAGAWKLARVVLPVRAGSLTPSSILAPPAEAPAAAPGSKRSAAAEE